MSNIINEYESVGEWATYRNAVLANEAERDRLSSPQVTTIIPTSPVHIAMPPPIMIPSANTIRDMPNASFISMLNSLTTATTRIEVIEEPINYNREPEIEHDDDPRLPYFPNNLASLRFYPLYIPKDDNTDERVIAPYIYYQNKGQEVVGCLK